MTIFSSLLAAAPAVEQAAEVTQQTQAMRVALITIAALAAANLLLIILMITGRKKKAE